MKYFYTLLLLSICHRACAQSPGSAPTFVVDGLEWMSDNLNVVHYWDGEPIPEARTIKEWKSYNEKKIGCYCNYDNESCYGQMYGKLYNWYAIKRGVAPHCWRLPKKGDFDRLTARLGTDSAGKKLKATHSWNNDWNGINTVGFQAFAGGCRNPMGTFSFVGKEGFWWTLDAHGMGNGREGGIYFFINYDDKVSYDYTEDFGFSVRCVRELRHYPGPCP